MGDICFYLHGHTLQNIEGYDKYMIFNMPGFYMVALLHHLVF